MKALLKTKREEGIWMGEVPMPEIGPNDVLIRIHKSAICGTDVHIYNWDEWAQKTIPVPMVVGHEYVGVIEKVGDEVEGYHPGDRVSGEGHITCGHCRNCRAGKRHLCRNTVGVGVNRPGSFAEYLSLPAFNVFKVPDNVSDEAASIFDPYGNAAHTALSFDMVGEDVLITGAGPIGIMAVAIAKHVGARHVVITDVNEYRLDLARKMGATRGRESHQEEPARGDEGPAHDRGLRRGPGDERQPQCLRIHAGGHAPWRPRGPAGHPARRLRRGLEPGDLQGPDPEGHLRPGDVRDLVQDGRHDPERPGHHARHHPPLRDR